MRIFLDALKKSWKNIEDEFFCRADKIFNKKLNEKFNCYLTTIERCSYDIKENYFFVSFFYSLPKALLSIGHEIFHFYFHRFYFKELEKKIGKDKTNDFKEVLAVY
ncbi:MAG: hypothetical protein QXX68_01850 [Candidatus Pacearchaeota archaeon]